MAVEVLEHFEKAPPPPLPGGERSAAGRVRGLDPIRRGLLPLSRLAELGDLSPPGRGEGGALSVMAGLVPAIDDLNTTAAREVVDAPHAAGQ
jgi:hypothetical protein